jgi:hypothetical protein
MNRLQVLFISYITDLITEFVNWDGTILQTKESLNNLPIWKLKAYQNLSIEQKLPVEFNGSPTLPKDLIVRIKSSILCGDNILFYIEYINTKKKTKQAKQIKAVKRKLERMSLFDDFQYEVKFYGDK